MNEKGVKNIFSPRTRVVKQPGKGRAQQQFKDDCNINIIMKRYQKTGAIDHYAKYGQEYGQASPVTLHEAMNIITRAQTMFNELPSTVRNRFDNSPQDFLAFVQDGKNAEEAKALGIGLAPGVLPVEAEQPTPLRQDAELGGGGEETPGSSPSPQDAG